MRLKKLVFTALAITLLVAENLTFFALPASAATVTLGNTSKGATVDSNTGNRLTAGRFTSGATGGTVSSMSVWIETAASAPSNKYALAIYNDTNGAPTTLLAQSATGTVVAASWNTLPITATLQPNKAYWLVYNTNGPNNRNTLRYSSGGQHVKSAGAVSFGTWPANFGATNNGSRQYSIYATYTTAPVGQQPIALVTDAANPYTSYYTEILTAEGLKAYDTIAIGDLTTASLIGRSVVVLGEMPLTTAQVTVLSDWVNNGGKLIAMRPDKKLANLLGLTDAAGTRADAYLKINTATGPGVGIVGETIQYHGTADNYTLNGATSVATLYASDTSATGNPAVATRNVGANGGQAAAFTYDLARSIVLTRQGNPAWGGQQRDGTDDIQASEMFYGINGQPDWNNLSKAIIPIADEQQRLLANMITQMSLPNKPLPRLWYLPRELKAAVVMTGDDHAGGGTAGRFNAYINQSPAGCNVANWECVRASSYIYTSTALSNSQATSYHNQGFEVGLHVSTNCVRWGTPAQLNEMYAYQLAAWHNKYTSLPNPDSSRTHCVEWDDWITQAKTKLAHGIRLDTDYYYYPASFTQNRPGYFNGTGTPMRFADLSGNLVNVYQATTQMTDESGQQQPYTINTLLDKAFGPEGYYATLTANMHTDTAASPQSDAIVAAAKARGVPVISGRQLLQWLDARNTSEFEAINWANNTLTFTLTGGANGLTSMVPAASATGQLTGLSRNGSAVPFTVKTVKGMQYAFFAATPGTYTAQYATDTTPPAIVATQPTAGATNVDRTAAVSLTFSEALSPATVNSGTIEMRDSALNLAPVTVAYNATTKSAVLTPTAALQPNMTYEVKAFVGVKDVVGNPLAAPYEMSFTTGNTLAPIGNSQVGVQTDTGDSNHMNGSRVVNGPLPSPLSQISVYVRGIAPAPNNKFRLAIYTDNGGLPGTLIAATTEGTLAASNGWNTLPITATLQPNTAYWFMYNTNGTNDSHNNMAYSQDVQGSGAWSTSGAPFASGWPASFGPATPSIAKYSIYAQ